MLASAAFAAAAPPAGVTHYVRFAAAGRSSYGRLEGDQIQPLSAEPWANPKPAGKPIAASAAKLLHPCLPPKVLAVGRNYKSHLGKETPPSRPELFYKPITCLIGPGESIVIPTGSKATNYEGELVIVIGKACRHASPAEAKAAIFGYTCGNDVSERDWQGGPDKDMQWWRAKGSDTFGPLGPVIAAGIDPAAGLQLQTRLNGQVVQKQSTSDLLFNCTDVVVFASRFVTLTPGDVIYTGTPGSTKPMKSGDVVEVEIDKIGVLRNPVKGA
ncbi:MAG: fumarylacetoacetate hydrolase family protein [Acidobacteria bacterium]|nr:fumarylacetoacetate hydrolase family protein [Acidobacteriota bacterium]